MKSIYHRRVLARAIGAQVSARALTAITRANLKQDRLIGLIAHPEYHFDGSDFARGRGYLEASRALVAEAQRPDEAWAAFGRLSHAAQDFYSHTNYVGLWRDRYPSAPPEAIECLNPAVLADPRLISARVYWPVEALWAVPALQPLLRRWLPDDSHARMNLDDPETGPLFPYSIEAAVQRTALEFACTLGAIEAAQGPQAAARFRDREA